MVGQPFWDVIFGSHVVERLTHYLDPEHLEPWRFYVRSTVRMVIESGAALAYLIGLFFVVREYPSKRDPRITALFVWYLVPVGAISFMTSKITHYMYPFLPAVAVVCGFGLARLLQQPMPTIGELGGKWLPRVPDRLGAVPLQKLIFTIALAPVIVMYGVALYDMRFRPDPFTALEACLDDAGVAMPIATFFGGKELANHVFTYHGLADRKDQDSALLQQLIHGDTPQPVWLEESQYRVLVSSDERALAIEAQRIPLAAVRIAPGVDDGAILLLPGKSAACSPRLSAAGAWRLEPTEHVIRDKL